MAAGRSAVVPRRASGISEYDANLFISALPPPRSDQEIFNALYSIPVCDPDELKLPAYLREQLVFIRCKQLFLPTQQQMRLALNIDLLIRAGYCGRNPENGDFIRLLNGLQRDDQLSQLPAPDYPGTQADSMVVLGPSGIGKTSTLRRCLAGYPQIIDHSSPASIRQIVWLRLDCPSGGSPKQLCISLFQEIDRLLGTHYFEKFGRLSTDHMLSRARHVAALHAIGLLAIDEVQHLRNASVGREQVLAFLTTLVNMVNVPVLMVGTMAAFDIFRQNFRIARRAEGVGSLVFEPLKRDKEWDGFLDKLNRLQWTSVRTEMTRELRDEFWEQSQGIIDVVIKLFMLAQMRAIRLVSRRGGAETMTPKLVRQVAQDSFKVVRPMLSALRRKDWKGLAKYDDLEDLDTHIARSLANDWKISRAIPDFETLAAEVGRRASASRARESTTLIAALTAEGLSDGQIKAVVDRVAAVRRSALSMSAGPHPDGESSK